MFYPREQELRSLEKGDLVILIRDKIPVDIVRVKEIKKTHIKVKNEFSIDKYSFKDGGRKIYPANYIFDEEDSIECICVATPERLKNIPLSSKQIIGRIFIDNYLTYYDDEEVIQKVFDIMMEVKRRGNGKRHDWDL